jgi:8-oxo-dGTP pyrophosphatase MutT (NUDIX family)
MNNRWRPNVTVAGIIFKNDSFLLVEEQTPKGLMLNNPAGHLDPGESIYDACVREVLEETGYAFTPSHLVGVYLYKSPGNSAGTDEELDDGTTYLRFAFCGELGDFDPHRSLDSGIERTLWMSFKEMQRTSDAGLHRSPLMISGAVDYLRGQRFDLTCLNTHENIYTK